MSSTVTPVMAAALAAASLLVASTGWTQGTARASPSSYPMKPVRMIVPLAPGGGSDIVGRLIASGLSERWGQPVIVDNRPGGGSTVGSSIAAKAPADGYTLLVSSSSIAISPALYRSLNFNIRSDFDEVTLLASQPNVVALHAAVPARSVKELIALARAHPEKLAYGSAGAGSATHLGTELLKHAAGISLLHVPYKSAGQATAALLAGEIQVLATNMASVLPHAASGKIRALAVTGLKRSPLAPDLPTVAEAGVPGFEYTTWYGMLVPAGTPGSVISHLYAATAETVKIPSLRARFAAQGIDIQVTSPASFERFLSAEIAKWDRVVRAAGVRAE